MEVTQDQVYALYGEAQIQLRITERVLATMGNELAAAKAANEQLALANAELLTRLNLPVPEAGPVG